LDDPGGIAEGVITHVPALRVPPLAAMSAAPASLVKCVTVVTLLDWSKAPGTSPISAASPIPAVPTATAATPRPAPIARSFASASLVGAGRTAGAPPAPYALDAASIELIGAVIPAAKPSTKFLNQLHPGQ